MQRMPKRPAIDWDDLRVVLAVHRSGSHGAAGRGLEVDPTTVGRRISALETAFGTRIFDRTPAGLLATEVGLALVARAERAEAEILAAERELGGADARLAGTVRVTASDGIVDHVIVPRLSDLRREHPGVTIELRASARALDLSRREADVAIRLARPTEPTLVARQLGKMRFSLYASRAYLDRRGVPRTASELEGHDLIGFDTSLDELPQARWLAKTVRGPRFVLRTTTTSAQVHACAEGVGIALLGTYLAPRETRLVTVLPSLQPPPREVWIVAHRDVRKSAKVTVVWDWLSRAVSPLDS